MADLGSIVYVWSCLINMAQVNVTSVNNSEGLVHSMKIYILFTVTETPGNSKYAEFFRFIAFCVQSSRS